MSQKPIAKLPLPRPPVGKIPSRQKSQSKKPPIQKLNQQLDALSKAFKHAYFEQQDYKKALDFATKNQRWYNDLSI